jgi:hypothetical protein
MWVRMFLRLGIIFAVPYIYRKTRPYETFLSDICLYICVSNATRVRGNAKKCVRQNDVGLLTRAGCAGREVSEIPVVRPVRMLRETEAVQHRSQVSLRDVRLQETL